jgi:hypothetical protein
LSSAASWSPPMLACGFPMTHGSANGMAQRPDTRTAVCGSCGYSPLMQSTTKKLQTVGNERSHNMQHDADMSRRCKQDVPIDGTSCQNGAQSISGASSRGDLTMAPFCTRLRYHAVTLVLRLPTIKRGEFCQSGRLPWFVGAVELPSLQLSE